MVKASIVIRAFNEEKHIEQLLKGISNQKVDFATEILLVDSGSSDATVQIASKYGARVISINPGDFTFGYSLNQGIERAKGEICVIVSAHCYPVNEHWLQEMVDPFVDEQIALVYGKQRGNHLTRYSEHQVFAKWFPDHDIKRQKLEFCNNANAAIRRKLWETVPYDEKITGLEDIDWARKVLRQGYFLSYAAGAELIHVHEETSAQIYSRYLREALTFKEIYPEQSFTLFDFLYLFKLNVAGDYIHALRDHQFLRNIVDIPLFRFLQFWATFKAHRMQNRKISNDLKRRLYYPKNPEIFRNLLNRDKAKKKTSEGNVHCKS